jgi:pimeloyl-ACP methyl ester carboxylesterase
VAAWLRHPGLASLREKTELANQMEFLVRENEKSFGMPFHPFLPEDPPPSERLGEIRVPTFVVWGDRDTETIQRNSAVTAERIPGARAVILRGAGHMVNLERPGEFNRVVRDLMQRTD